jgi:hypothetical protein
MKRLTKEAKAAAALKRYAKSKGLKGERAANLVYGSLNKIGLMKGNKVTPRGKSPAHKGK